MFSRLNLKVRCERRRRNKSYTSTGLARKRLTRSPFAPWLLLLMILWKYPLPWCWLSQQPYKSTWAGSGWLEEAISNDWVPRQSIANSGGASRIKAWLLTRPFEVIHIIISERKEYGEKWKWAEVGPTVAIQCSLPFHCTGYLLLYSYNKILLQLLTMTWWRLRWNDNHMA